MMIHNIVIVDNKEYQAVNDLADRSCDGCDLALINCRYAVCEQHTRKDVTEVVYKRHYRPSVAALENYVAVVPAGDKRNN